MELIEELLGLVDALQAERVEYALCGGRRGPGRPGQQEPRGGKRVAT